MSTSQKPRSFFIRGLLAIGSGILWILSFPKVRGWIWETASGKVKQKIVEAEAREVPEKRV
jgi:hypothetical protein